MFKGLHLLEKYFLSLNYYIIGVDEVGRGSIAGPIVAGGFMLSPSKNKVKLFKSSDSKVLEYKEIYTSAKRIINNFDTWAVYGYTAEFIDKNGIVKANQMSMEKVITNLTKTVPDEFKAKTIVLIDGLYSVKLPLVAKEISIIRIAKGDKDFLTIQYGALVAKYIRDYLMRKKYNKKFNGYLFDKNKGYSTKKHREAIGKYGVSVVHRKTFVHNRAVL